MQQASRELIDVARDRAAATLEASPADLVFDLERGRVHGQGRPDITVPLARSPSGAAVRAHASSPRPAPTFPFGAHVAVVEVDAETGKAFLRAGDHRR